MATTKRKDIELTLVSLNIAGAHLTRATSHALKATLVWPRMGIAQKSSEQEVKLKKGILATEDCNWCRTILFKETVEDCFGLQFSLSIALSKAKLKEFGRYLLGYSMKIAGEIAEDSLPYPAGNLAETPFLYLNKKLLATHDIDLLAKGSLDLNASTLEGESLLTAKLYSVKKITAGVTSPASPKTSVGKTLFKVLAEENTEIGSITIRCRCL